MSAITTTGEGALLAPIARARARGREDVAVSTPSPWSRDASGAAPGEVGDPRASRRAAFFSARAAARLTVFARAAATAEGASV